MLYSIGLIFVMHQHELSIGIHISPPSWTSLWPPTLPHPSRLLQSTGDSFLSHIASSHWLSILHMVLYTCTLKKKKKKNIKSQKIEEKVTYKFRVCRNCWNLNKFYSSIVCVCVNFIFWNVPWLCKMFIGESKVKLNRLYHFFNFLWSYIISKCNKTNWRKLCTNPYPEIAIDNVF